MFVLVSALGGVLVAGLAVPAAAAIGATGTALSSSLAQLPDYLVTVPPAERSTIYMADNSVLATEYEENRTLVTLDQIAPVMQQAQLAIEDHRFYEHGALDLRGLLQAILTNLPGGSDGRGGSTLTQQYVKQARVEAAQTISDETARNQAVADATANTLDRKIVEMRYAIGLEKQLTKDQILDNYLNIAYYGDGAYGVQAAAYHYFGVSAADLTLPEAAMLAGIVQAPSRNPVSDLAGATSRRDVVLDQMAKYGYVTQDQADEAKQAVFDPNGVQTTRNGCVGSRYPFICQLAENTIKQMPAFGDNTTDRWNTFRRGGYSVYLAIDPAKQDAVQAAVSSQVPSTDPVISVATAVQPGTGLILAMAQNRYDMGADQDAGQTYYNYATQAGFQAGSTFKAFTIAAALSVGVAPTKTYNAARTMDFSTMTFQSCAGPYKEKFTVSNDTTSGVMNMYNAAAWSVNTYFMQLEQTVGICPVAQMAAAAGLQMQDASYNIVPIDPNNSLVDVATLTLGVVPVTPLSMAAAYATFAARGVHCDPIMIDSITDRDGANIPPPSANCQQTIDPAVADGVNRVLSGVWNGTGRGLRPSGGSDAAGKTGTIEDNKAVWFMGYTPDVAMQAMIAYDADPHYAPFWDARGSTSIKGMTLSNGNWLAGTGGGDAGAIWKPAMNALVAGLPASHFTAPTSTILNGKKVPVPNAQGMPPDQAQKVLEAAGFTVLTQQTYSDTVPAGGFIDYTCDGRFAGTCYLVYSQGPRPG